MQKYHSVIAGITKTNHAVRKKAEERLNMLCKPPGSLGVLEEIAAKLASITGSMYNTLDKKNIIVFAADNGIYEEGVASAPQAVTMIQSLNMLKGITGVCVLARHAGSDVTVIDVGINSDIKHPKLIDRKIRRSTNNITKGPAMDYEEAETAIEAGIEAVEKAYETGSRLIGIGEMGIANTTTSSAVLAALFMLNETEIDHIVGRGAGLTDRAYAKKILAIKTALKINNPDHNNPLDIIAKVGGFDIAAMTGAYLGAAYYQIPVVIDGFISLVAALCAAKINPLVIDYMFASHHSRERGYAYALKKLGLKACLQMKMRLGEGSGCPLMFGIMDAACLIMRDMATFEEAMIDMEYLKKVSAPNAF